ncbi:hypothetical protein V6V89_38920, partial [Micromonospora sp. CPCC 206061]
MARQPRVEAALDPTDRAAEALFTALLVGGMLALCWSRRPGVVACGGAGLLLAAATTTRTVGLPLIGIAVLY